MPDQLEYPEDPHDPHQADHLPCLPDNLEVLQPLQQQGQVEGDDGADVDNVHGVPDELEFVWADQEPDDELEGEEDDDEVVGHLDDEHHHGPLALPLGVHLELVRGGDDEGDGGEDHHGQREERQELRQAAGPRVLDGVPHPGPPLAKTAATKVLLFSLFHGLANDGGQYT